MDQASIEFLRYLLPVDDKEVRITSRDATIRVDIVAMAVNREMFATTETLLDRKEIEEASKYIKGYDVRPHAKTLPEWIARKPILLWDTNHGAVLLDGRQRAAQRFSEGDKKVLARVIVKKDGRMADLERVTKEICLADQEPENPLFANMHNLRLAGVPNLRSFQIAAAFFKLPGSSAESDANRVGGNRPRRPEYHWLQDLVIVSVYATLVAKKIVRKKRKKEGCIDNTDNRYLTIDNVAKDMLPSHFIPAFIKNSVPKSIDAIIGLESIETATDLKGARAYEEIIIKQTEAATFQQIEESLVELNDVANLLSRAKEIVGSYERMERENYRIGQGKLKGNRVWNFISTAIHHITNHYRILMTLDERLRASRRSGVNIPIFYGDPPCVRCLGGWLAYVFWLETTRGPITPPSPAMCDTFLQRLAMKKELERLGMEKFNEYDVLTEQWKKLFDVLEEHRILDRTEQQCWDVIGYKRP
jgi:hypothetical protein